jgi:hypothetical protein
VPGTFLLITVLSHHCFRFMERCGANTNSPCGYLPSRNLCTFVAVGVRARSQSVEVYLVLIGFYILLEGLQVQHHGWRRQFAQAAGFPISLALGPAKRCEKSTSFI